MLTDILGHVVYAAIPYSNGVPIKNFLKHMVTRKMFIKKFQKYLSDIRFDSFAEGGIEPDFVSAMSPSSRLVSGGVGF